ncbi:hypothetical protein M5E87_08710 [Flavonifractor plautii]|nr:hypothetical protein M5E87_08710 [Flavonifractor plautii]
MAMRDASDLAREVADITLLSSDLRELAALRRLSQRMLERINRNYRSILTINTSLLALGIFGILPPTTTALLHNASTMAISAASMRPYLPGGRPRERSLAMKQHRFWAWGAVFCMLMCIYTGKRRK